MNAILKSIAKLDPAPPWGLPTAIGTFIAAFAAMVAGITLTNLLFGGTRLATVGGWSIGVIIIALFVTVSRNRTPQDRDALGIGETQAPLFIVLIFSFGMAILYDLIGLAATGVSSAVPELWMFFGNPTISLTDDFAAWFVAILFLVVFQPVAETFVFRGVLYPALRAQLGAWMGFLWSAVFFALFHLLAYTTNPQSTFPFMWYALILPLLNGFYLNTVRAYTGSTRAALIAQMGLALFAVLRALMLIG